MSKKQSLPNKCRACVFHSNNSSQCVLDETIKSTDCYDFFREVRAKEAKDIYTRFEVKDEQKTTGVYRVDQESVSKEG